MRTILAALATAAAQPSNSTYYGMYKATWATSDPASCGRDDFREIWGGKQ